MVVIFLSTLLILFGLINGDLGYMGVYSITERRISPFGALCFIALPPLSIISNICVLWLPSHLGKYRKALIVTSVLLLIAIVPMGRRVLMYTLMLNLFLIGHWVKVKIKFKKRRYPYLIAGVLSVAIIFSWGFRAFFVMRLAVEKAQFRERPPIMEIIPYYAELLQDSYAQAEINERLAQNISQRPFVLSYLAGLFSIHEQKKMPWFAELHYAITMSVPSALYHRKLQVQAASSEDLVHPMLGLPVYDGPSTIITAGLNDMGILGIIIYPMTIIGLFIVVFRFIPSNWQAFIRIFILLRLLYSLLCFEVSLGELISYGLRDLFIVVLFYWILYKIPLKGSMVRYQLAKGR